MAHETYLTYAEYNSYGGTMVTEAVFPLYEAKARKRIDYITDSRVQAMRIVPSIVKLCTAALIDMESKVGEVAQATNPTVTSFSTDGYSESYGTSMDVGTANLQMNRLVSGYLYGEKDDKGVPLLYRGVR